MIAGGNATPPHHFCLLGSNPNRDRPIVLVYGPDRGLVQSRVEALTRPTDPGVLTRIDGNAVAADRWRLLDEIRAVPMFGDHHVIHVRVGTKNILPAIEAATKLPEPNWRACRLIIEAGDPKSGTPRRSLWSALDASRSSPANAGRADLVRMVRSETQTAGLTDR